MVHATYTKFIPLSVNRAVNTTTSRSISSKVIRQKFLDYFLKEKGHFFVKSSPVVPYHDHTLPFVNAGMTQFKGIFLGTQEPQHTKVANSQKCIRVGGKHNDLNAVGTDGYHHTFFEMLGNWSFGDYFKKEACEMAWDLLTSVYKVPKSRLYVTYFMGDPKLGIPEDLETKEIWRQIGVPANRILPFGPKDNFWEMGLTGPCGPCTEIHVDHLGSLFRGEFVNKGLHDLTEIWNVVFIEYDRQLNGNVVSLPKKHVDTGMGLERLTSVLQGTTSNYDTDNFTYLLEAIAKICSGLPKYRRRFGESDWDQLDTSYRILADHTRMITACLSDGMIPEQNHKLRKIMRRAFLIGETYFKTDRGLVKELSNYVVDHLGSVYPEMERNIGQVHQIVSYEEDVYKFVRQSAKKDWLSITKENPRLLELDIVESPSFIAAYKELRASRPAQIHSALAFKLYDTYGLDEEAIAKVSQALDIKFDPEEMRKGLECVQMKSRIASAISQSHIARSLEIDGVPKTDDSYKYNYAKNSDGYFFGPVKVRVLKIFRDQREYKEVAPECFCSLLLDKTNLYSRAGGQAGDRGVILFGDNSFAVTDVENVGGYVLHRGFFKSEGDGTMSRLKVDDEGVIFVDEPARLNCMRGHTSVHLLNAVLKKLRGATCQKSSSVQDKYLNFDVAVFGHKLTIDDVLKVEMEILDLIDRDLPVVVREVSARDLLEYDQVTLIPGEVYPDTGIRVVEVVDYGFVSREPCCGTHVLSTADIEDFCVVGLKSLGRSTSSIVAVTGDRARNARENGEELMDQIDDLQRYIKKNIDKPDLLNTIILTLKTKLASNVEDESVLPISMKQKCLQRLEAIDQQIRDTAQENLRLLQKTWAKIRKAEGVTRQFPVRDFVEMEMQTVLDGNVKSTKSNKRYIVHYLRSSMILDSVPLHKATNLCPDIPILVISYADNKVKARCCVPKDLITNNFNAEKWMKQTVATVFKSSAAGPKGQDGSEVCNMREKRVHMNDWDPLLHESIQKAVEYVEEHL